MDVNNNGSGKTKADVILSKVDNITQQNKSLGAKVDQIIESSVDRDMDREAIMQKLSAENKILLQEIEFLSAQIQSIYKGITKSISESMESKPKAQSAVAEQMAVEELSAQEEEKTAEAIREIDYAALADEVAARIVLPEIDIDALAEQVAAKLTAPSIDVDALGLKVAESLYIPTALVESIDYDELASKIVANAPAQEVVSPDYIASKVAEQMVFPTIDEEQFADKVAQKIAETAQPSAEVALDEEKIAETVAEKLRANSCEAEPEKVEAVAENVETEETVEEQVVAQQFDADAVAALVAAKIAVPAVSTPEIDLDALAEKIASKLDITLDDEEIADCVAKKVGTISPEQFDVMVDDDGCDSIAKAVESKLDYDAISAAVAERLGGQMTVGTEMDADEIARQLSEKLNVGVQINEDALADKAAAVLSNYMPEIDTDEIAEKVVAGVVPSIPQVEVDGEGIAASVVEKLAEKQEDQDFDIVIDDDGLERIAKSVAENVNGEYNERFNSVEQEIREVKAMLAAGVIAVSASDEITTAKSVEEEGGTEEELVTVSDIVEEQAVAYDSGEQDDVIDEIVDDIDESPVDGEIMPDGMPGISNSGVDFSNMMKYNRSFIARIIQGSDEQKQLYGQVKNALLSYKKVNSNIAWGAERFNKGRETIARFKIRGKTLCLYLALDPKEYPTTVYHQVDASDNKSMNGTPMMLKIKSPRGAKKAIRLIDEMLQKRQGVKQHIVERDYAAMYPYESIEELIEDGLVKDVSKK